MSIKHTFDIINEKGELFEILRRVHMQELDDKSQISYLALFQYLTFITLNTFRRMQTRYFKYVTKSVVIQKQPFINFELTKFLATKRATKASAMCLHTYNIW